METLSNLHPVVVHFPIAFFIMYFFIEASGVIFKKDYFTRTAPYVLAVSIFFSLIAVLTGNQSHEAVKMILKNKSSGLNVLIEQHERLATLSLWYFSAVLFFRIYLITKNKFDVKFGYLFILLGAIGCVLIIFAGYYGGVLVFEHGIGTNLFGK